MTTTLRDAGLLGLCANETLELYGVVRASSSTSSLTGVGKDAIFRARAHFDPPVRQSSRGVAIFLSTIRVVTSVLQDMSKDDSAAYDAVLHVFDLLTGFPPALRALDLLSQGKTPSASECAAFSLSVFMVLQTFMPTELVGTERRRLFEGARLLFGFFLEKGRSVKFTAALPDGGNGQILPYVSAFTEQELRDCKTNEPLLYAVTTKDGLVERNYLTAFGEGGALTFSPLQSYLSELETPAELSRAAICSGGSTRNLITFSRQKLDKDYHYQDAGDLTSVIDASEMHELEHLAELCGRNKLAVHKPSQLLSAVSPCLTFDRTAQLAVYTGEQPCGSPGQSSLIFRPMYGTETIDTAVVEQLIAPILRTYEAAGTAVFDALGGASLKKLQEPDEVVMFCVDCSARMRRPTDFEEVNEEDDVDDSDDASTDQAAIEGHFFGKASLDEVKEMLTKHENFDDMTAIVTAANDWRRRRVARDILNLLSNEISQQVTTRQAAPSSALQRAVSRYAARSAATQLEASLEQDKTFYGSLKTHEEGLADFIIFRAMNMPRSQRWTWSIGDTVPSTGRARHIPSLSSDLTEIPDKFCCPISKVLMEDAMKATHGHTYSRQALVAWFVTRKSSPMHGTALSDDSITSDDETSQAAREWADGARLIVSDTEPVSRPAKKRSITLRFNGNLGSFDRTVAADITIEDLHRLAFRGFKGRHNIFQLAIDNGNRAILPSSQSASSVGIRNGDTITVRIADEDDVVSAESSQARQLERALVKVYRKNDAMSFAFWADRYTSQTVAGILWKHRRHSYETLGSLPSEDLQVWTSMSDSGDGFSNGTPCQDSEAKLSRFFNRTHCFGHLQEESVFIGAHPPSTTGPLVLKVQLNGIHRPSTRVRLSRMDVLKQLFEAIINRVQGYGFNTHVGLVTFASEAAVSMPISRVIENFRRATSDMHAKGDTALWDAIALARDQLKNYSYPNAKRRIICLSDGADSKSVTNTPDGVAWNLLQDGIALDSISLGSEYNQSLKAVSHILGCYRFHPESLANALAICELEPFLSITERDSVQPPASLPRKRSGFNAYLRNESTYASYTVANSDNFPKRKDHPNLHDSMISLSDAVRRPAPATNPAAAGSNARSNLRITRLMSEMRKIASGPPRANYDVCVSETDMSFWKVVMSGPSDSPYSTGTFLLYIHAEEGYPAFAPKCRFITRVLHPNVNAHGRICHSILDRDWTSDTSMTTLLDTIFGLLMQPGFSDPVSTTATLGYHHDTVEFYKEAKDHTDQYANQRRAEWKEELLEL